MANPSFQGQGRPVARTDEINETKNFTIPTPRSAGNDPQNCMVGQPKNQIEEMHFDNFPVPSSFSRWRTSFTTEVCSGSKHHPVWEDEFHNRSVIWFQLPCGINALEKVEMATSAHDLDMSRWVFGNLFPCFQTRDEKIASSLKEIFQKFEPQEKSQSGSAEDSIR